MDTLLVIFRFPTHILNISKVGFGILYPKSVALTTQNHTEQWVSWIVSWIHPSLCLVVKVVLIIQRCYLKDSPRYFVRILFFLFNF